MGIYTIVDQTEIFTPVKIKTLSFYGDYIDGD
jgi:hypothetical protein